MHNIIQPYLSDLLTFFINILVAFLVWLTAHIKNYYVSKTTKTQRDMLHMLGYEAFSLSKQLFTANAGTQKLQFATNYIQKRLDQAGITYFTAEDIRGVIEKIYTEYKQQEQKTITIGNASMTTTGSTIQTTGSAPQTAQVQTSSTTGIVNP